MVSEELCGKKQELSLAEHRSISNEISTSWKLCKEWLGEGQLNKSAQRIKVVDRRGEQYCLKLSFISHILIN